MFGFPTSLLFNQYLGQFLILPIPYCLKSSGQNAQNLLFHISVDESVQRLQSQGIVSATWLEDRVTYEEYSERGRLNFMFSIKLQINQNSY